MPTSPLMLFLLQILVWLENPVVVWTLVAAVIGIRYLWLRTHPRPAMAKAASVSLDAAKGKQTAGVPAKSKDVMLEIIDTVLIALILVFGIVRPFLLQTFFIPSPSMVPTLEVHDRLIADKFIYFFRPPMRGEVVVFDPPEAAIIGNGRRDLQLRWWLENHPNSLSPDELRVLSPGLGLSERQLGELAHVSPNELESALLQLLPNPPSRREDYIKRVIGVPGDHIRIHAGEGVYINGVKLPETYLPKFSPISSFNFPEPYTLTLTPPRMRKNLRDDMYPGQFFAWLRERYLSGEQISPHVVKAPDGKYEFVVPENSIFMMGDNRVDTKESGGSFDSRYWGVVPYKRVKARAVSTFWPLNHLKLL